MKKMLSLFLVAFFMAPLAAEKWVLKGEDDKTCVILESNATGTLKIHKENVTETITFAINKTKIGGSCTWMWNNQSVNLMQMSFFPNGITPKATEAQPWMLYLVFADGENAFQLVDYVLETSSTFFGISTQNFTKAEHAELDVEAKGTNAFKCSTSALALTSDSTIQLKNLKVIAKARIQGEDFPKQQVYEQCFLDARTSDVVPIVVGACLAGLVVIVLIAYLIGRARARRQGYASV